jgi:hypothetical protein
MTPFNPNYHDRLYTRAEELVRQNQLPLLIQDLRALGKTPYEIDIEVLFSLIHEGYRQRCLEEKFWEDADWDFEI